VRVSEVIGLGWPGVATVALLALAVRPANVLVSTLASGLDAREKAYLSWIAPRGIVAAAVASLFNAVLDEAGMPGGAELRALVFLTIALTVIVQAGSAPLVAAALRVRVPGRDSVVILGAGEVGLALGEILRRSGVRIVFLDANPAHCRAAEERGFPVVFGNALEERVLARARRERARAAIGVSPNDEVNGLFAREAREEFGVRDCYAAVGPGGGVTPAMLARRGIRTLFEGPKEVERWNVRMRHQQARIEELVYAGKPVEPPGEAVVEGTPPEARAGAPEACLMLALRRGEVWSPWHADLEPKPEGVAAVALYLAEEDAARRALEEQAWRRRPDPPRSS
jgi:hypothetical protein